MATGWRHISRVPGFKVARITPVRFRKKLHICLVREGCANRPFFTIHVKTSLQEATEPGLEQIGSYDAIPNAYGELCVAINFERLRFWLANNATPTRRVAEILGLGGFLPVYPRTLLAAHRVRSGVTPFFNKDEVKEVDEDAEKEKEKLKDNIRTYGFGISKRHLVGLN